MRYKPVSLCRTEMFIVLVASLFSALPAEGAILFSENFESYNENTNLSGQGGWTGGETTVATGPGLSTKVANGRIEPGRTNNTTITSNSFSSPLTSTRLYTLSYDAFAYSTGPRSHNTGIYFVDSSSSRPILSAGWFITSNTDDLWTFDVRDLTEPENLEKFDGGYDKPVHLEVILDPVGGEVWGRADFGSGFFETTRYSMTPSQFATIGGIGILQDYRWSFTSGAEFDNIVVESSTPVPEPAISILGYATALGFGAFFKRKRNK